MKAPKLFLLIFLMVVLISFIPAEAFASPSIGLGLAYRRGTPAQVANSGAKWVYEWSALTDRYRAFNAAGIAYVPMLYKCRSGDLNNAINWPLYGDYMLFMNEPDGSASADQGNCNANTAADYFHRLKTARPDLKIIVGGVVTNGGWHWLSQFGIDYKRKYGRDPDVAGIHFHIYSNYGNKQVEEAIADMKNQLQKWYDWQNRKSWARGKELWLTETGSWKMEYYSMNSFMRDWLSFLSQQQRLTRVAWFTFDMPQNNRWKITAISVDGVPNIHRFPIFQSIAGRSPAAPRPGSFSTPTPTPTSTPTPTPMPTPTPVPLGDVNQNGRTFDRGDVICAIAKYLSQPNRSYRYPSSNKIYFYDINQDGLFNRSDVISFIVYYLQSPKSAPSGNCLDLPAGVAKFVAPTNTPTPRPTPTPTNTP
ncbi:MAG: hypothetical protein GXP43_00815, partial [bacterium]|nr:hypothetical protein [bacterium]